MYPLIVKNLIFPSHWTPVYLVLSLIHFEAHLSDCIVLNTLAATLAKAMFFICFIQAAVGSFLPCCILSLYLLFSACIVLSSGAVLWSCLFILFIFIRSIIRIGCCRVSIASTVFVVTSFLFISFAPLAAICRGFFLKTKVTTLCFWGSGSRLYPRSFYLGCTIIQALRSCWRYFTTPGEANWGYSWWCKRIGMWN